MKKEDGFMKDGLFDFLSLADDVVNTPQDDPSFEEKSNRFAKAFMNSFVPKEYTTIINPVALKKATGAIREIRKVVDDSMQKSYGNEIKPEYSLRFSGFAEEHLDFTVRVCDAWLDIKSIDFFGIVPNMPDDFLIEIAPVRNKSGKNGFEVTFEFRNVKDFLSKGHTESDEWFE